MTRSVSTELSFFRRPTSALRSFLVLLVLLAGFSGTGAASQLSGFAYLDGQSNHNGITVDVYQLNSVPSLGLIAGLILILAASLVLWQFQDRRWYGAVGAMLLTCGLATTAAAVTLIATTTTLSTGEWSVNVPNGSYQVVFSHSGFTTGTLDDVAVNGDTNATEVTLTTEPTPTPTNILAGPTDTPTDTPTSAPPTSTNTPGGPTETDTPTASPTATPSATPTSTSVPTHTPTSAPPTETPTPGSSAFIFLGDLRNDGTTEGANIGMGVTYNSFYYFPAYKTGSGGGIFRTDGTEAGTVKIAGSPIYGIPNNLTVCNNLLFFSVNAIDSGTELWKSDGTAVGTVRIKDIRPGTTASSPSKFFAVGNSLFFEADDGVNNKELWMSDGTEGGTVMVKNIHPTATSVINDFAERGGILYFAATDTAAGREIWRSDGTEAGTFMVKNIRSGSTGSSPDHLTTLGSKVYFQANDGTNGIELWATDGTTAGTSMVMDINPGAAHSQPSSLAVLGFNLIFQANDGTNGAELWISDGTAVGTTLLKDINPTAGQGSSPTDCLAIGSTEGFRGAGRAYRGVGTLESIAARPASPEFRVEHPLRGEAMGKSGGVLSRQKGREARTSG